VFMPAYFIMTVNIYENFIDIFPLLAILCSTCAFLFKEDRYIVSRLFILNCVFWIIYSLTVGAYVQILNCLLMGSSIVIGIIRHENISLSLNLIPARLAILKRF